jgi:hypothetical protein
VWYAEQQTGLRNHFLAQGEPEKAATVNTSWPIRTE